MRAGRGRGEVGKSDGMSVSEDDDMTEAFLLRSTRVGGKVGGVTCTIQLSAQLMFWIQKERYKCVIRHPPRSKLNLNYVIQTRNTTRQIPTCRTRRHDTTPSTINQDSPDSLWPESRPFQSRIRDRFQDRLILRPMLASIACFR